MCKIFPKYEKTERLRKFTTLHFLSDCEKIHRSRELRKNEPASGPELTVPVEGVEVVIFEPHDEHGIVLLADSTGVAGELHGAPRHPVHGHRVVWHERYESLYVNILFTFVQTV